ncbi:MAG: PEP-CTERM sorting domain-containing protein [Myxococcota bacterium]
MFTLRSLSATLGLLLGLASSAPALAGSLQLDFVADGDSRWFDWRSDAFAQLDQGFQGDPVADGFFLISVEGFPLNEGVEADFDAFDPVLFTEVGQGPSVFESEDEFTGIGLIEWDDVTGNVTNLTLDVDDFVAFNDAALNFLPSLSLGYDTIVSNVSGTVTTVGSFVALIDATADVTFSYRGGDQLFDGSIIFSTNRFDLFVDETELQGVGLVRHSWDIEGDVAHVAPEPHSGLAIALLGGAMLARKRRS